MSRRPRPLPVWWPAGRPWPPPEVPARRAAPAWWPEGEPWRAPSRERSGEAPRAFPVGLAILFALAVNVVGAGVLALARGPIGALPWAYAWPVSVLMLATLSAVAFVAAVRWIGAPLSQVVAAAHRVGSGDYSVRVAEQGLPWLRSLAAAFNGMAARLERQQRERRALMADVAHELRTPVAIIQGRLEGMLDGVYPANERHLRQAAEQTQMLARLVEDLRTSAHAESGTLPLHREATDIGALVEDVAQAYPTGRRVRIETHLAPDLPALDVDPQRIREVLLNLLSNAVRHSPDGGIVTITCGQESGGAVVRIADRGPGIPDVHLGRVFERFFKGRDSTGSGLGLTIVKGLVEAHSGSIGAANRPEGGTVMTFRLPGSAHSKRTGNPESRTPDPEL